MTDPSHVLAAIDHALEDYATSDDAMRWTPEQGPFIDGGGLEPDRVFVGLPVNRQAWQEDTVREYVRHELRAKLATTVESLGLVQHGPPEERVRDEFERDNVLVKLVVNVLEQD